ncbi:TetR/AcrR family transcriptional regulator [Nonomuraea sp. NPDC049152]|uniref:TetR/AcrR family transcriptional regulator n=1 Tax=Nonomuraea sp. NPDC049152 TaxID=3154350 RepID=UPI00340FBF17
MARPKQFDEDLAIDAAMRAFWTAGYEATSTQDLCEATGLGRSSVYNTFKSKRDLFEKALRRYMDDKNAPFLDLLGSGLPLREKVRELLWGVVESDERDPLGCLVVNSMVELAPRDEEVAAMLRRDHDLRFEALRTALETGRRLGETDKDPAELAHFLIAVIGGMRVAVRGGAGRSVLESIARNALDAL